MTLSEKIIAGLPYGPPFLFVDKLSYIDEAGAEGTFRLDHGLDFYKGHFKALPVTPGVILTEIMAQIGLVCLGAYLAYKAGTTGRSFVLTATDIEFLKPVFPGETVRVKSEKVYFRFGKLKCRVYMYNEENVLVCEGTIAGMALKNEMDVHA